MNFKNTFKVAEITLEVKLSNRHKNEGKIYYIADRLERLSKVFQVIEGGDGLYVHLFNNPTNRDINAVKRAIKEELRK